MDESVIFNDTNIAYNSWTNQNSMPFTATSTSHNLQFFTFNPLGGDRAVYIDLIAIDIATPQASTSVYTGCYVDSTIRLLPVEKGTGRTVSSCAAACKTYKWFGVENGGECYCGYLFIPDMATQSTECNMTCKSDRTQSCGGLWAINIYRITSLSIDLDFESYSAALQSNTGYGGKNFLGENLAAQTPWSYTGGFQIGLTNNSAWGGLPAVSGSLYAIFQGASSIQQQINNLNIGSSYVVSWYVVARPGYPTGLDLGKFIIF